jgi:hypothetical protein
VASDLNKPDGSFCVPASRAAVTAFAAALPVRKIPGIGRVMEQQLAALGVHTCAELLACGPLLSALFSATAMDFFLPAALGLGATRHADRPGGWAGGRAGGRGPLNPRPRPHCPPPLPWGRPAAAAGPALGPAPFCELAPLPQTPPLPQRPPAPPDHPTPPLVLMLLPPPPSTAPLPSPRACR